MLGGPAVHFALIGALLFVAVQAGGTAPPEERPQIVIPAQRIAEARRAFSATLGRHPTDEEQQRIVDTLVDRAVLFEYAMRLGLNRQDAAQRRLALIASFVASEPEQALPPADLAERAVAWGLHERDLVFRRLMIDSAGRLIRAAMVGREPNQAMLEAYLHDHAELFAQPAQTRITQIAVLSLVHGAATEADAGVLLERLRATSATGDEAATLGDDFFIEASLPALDDGALARRFGHHFVRALNSAPVGVWSGPVPSRYGLHLVYVHERREPRVLDLEEVRDQVCAALKEQLAQEWLALRLGHLRREFDIVVQEAAS